MHNAMHKTSRGALVLDTAESSRRSRILKASLQTSLPPMELNSIDGARPTGSVEASTSQSSSMRLTTADVVKDALVRCHGTLKAAAITLGMDQGQLTRELQTGDFKLKKLDVHPETQAFVSVALHEAFGASDPKARVRRLIREARARLDELAEVVA